MIVTELASACAVWLGVLIRQSLYASIVFVVVLGLTTVLRRRFPALQLALWSLVLLRLVLPLDLGHPLSFAALVSRIGGVEGSSAGIVLDASFIPLGSPAPSSVRGPVEEGAEDSIWPVLLGSLWAAGAVLSLGGFLRRRRALHQVLRHASPVVDPRAVGLAERWRRSFGVRRRVRLLSSGARIGPFTTGLVVPTIFLPAPIVAGDVLEPVIAHEMAHVARWDSLSLLLEHAIRIVYFFHPAAWIATVRLDQERENICDSLVLAGGTVSPRVYAGGLLDALRLDLGGVEAPTLISPQRRIHMRIRNILESSEHRPRTGIALGVALVLGVLLLPMQDGRSGAATADQAVPSTATNRAQGSPFLPRPGIAVTDPLPDARVSRSWGKALDPFTGQSVFHRGIDLAAKQGTPVRAAAAGVVEVATTRFEPEPGAGTVVVLHHDGGYTTFYSHLGSLEVNVDQRVSQGEVIATVGSTGKSTGPHLHFEVRRDGEALNPADFIEEWRR